MIPQVTLVQKISSEDVPSPSCNGAQKSICCTLSGILITASMTQQGENYGRNIRLFAKNLYPLNSIQPVCKRLLDTLISPRAHATILGSFNVSFLFVIFSPT